MLTFGSMLFCSVANKHLAGGTSVITYASGFGLKLVSWEAISPKGNYSGPNRRYIMI